MTLSSRSVLASAILVTAVSPQPFMRAQTPPPDTPHRITAAANVTVRAMPSPDALVVAQVPLGTEVADAGPAGLDKIWVRVRLADGREGWLLAKLTRSLDPIWRWPTFDGIIADRLGRKGDGFPAAAELVAFIERVAPEYTDADGRARIELSRLRALSAALDLVPAKGGTREPYARWLVSRHDEVVYDTPGGRWMLAPTAIWNVHARNASAPTADDIAWFTVGNGLPGECSGRIACYLSARNQLHGEYLRRLPFGRHAAEAVEVVKNTAETLAAPPQPRATYAFDRARDCRDLSESVDALASAVQATRLEHLDAALGSLAAIRQLCRQPAATVR